MALQLWPGRDDPLGATWDGKGVNFAVYSENASGIDLCLFDAPDGPETQRLPLRSLDGRTWHGYVIGLAPGQLYGFRVHGRYAPHDGLRFNPAKLLLDPYARAIAGGITWGPSLYDFQAGSGRELMPNNSDSAAGMPRCVVVDATTPFDWQGDHPPAIPLSDTIVYETHVKGFTQLHPDVPAALRGTYAGLASQPAIQHLTSLGVTAVELLPVQQFADDEFLVRAGLVNYWGYQPIGHFAPAARYSSSGDRGQQVSEFKQMVRALHAAGLEVILDVVYNHTAESDRLGPTLSFRGIDNPTYYLLSKGDQQYYVDFSGVGNTFNVDHLQVLKLVTDSLRYWVQEMHVDGFRFDLASVLGLDRESGMLNFDRSSRFFDTVYQDPTLAHVKLFAEPWASGQFFELGQFPLKWSEWNGKYRDNVRRFVKGDSGQAPELASRLSGSSDLFAASGRGPLASVNYVTVHDGLTLRDLVSYNSDSSWDCRTPGWTDAQVESLRSQQQRNFLTLLLVSIGVPLVQGGDEIGRTQQGNPNAYNQDNATSWYNWNLTDSQRALLTFTRQLSALRKAHPILRRGEYFVATAGGSGLKDVSWHRPDGAEMSARDWGDGNTRALGMRLAGDSAAPDDQGQPRPDDPLFVLLNAWWGQLPFVLPAAGVGDTRWELLLDTSSPTAAPPPILTVGQSYPLAARSMAILRGRPA